MMLNWIEYRDQISAAVKEIAGANPDIVRAYAGLNGANAKSTHIDAKTRELLALVVAVASMRWMHQRPYRRGNPGGRPRRRSSTPSESPSR